MSINKAKTYLKNSIAIKEQLIKENLEDILLACETISKALNNNHIVYLMGNGGSAADAQHWAAEFVGRFLKERKAMPAVALTTNTSVLTAIANDYSFDKIFSRQIEAFVNKDDLVIAISTSGNSQNLINGLNTAKQKGAKTISLLGNAGGKMKNLADISIIINSSETPHIQEAQITIEHLIVKIVEENLKD